VLEKFIRRLSATAGRDTAPEAARERVPAQARPGGGSRSARYNSKHPLAKKRGGLFARVKKLVRASSWSVRGRKKTPEKTGVRRFARTQFQGRSTVSGVSIFYFFLFAMLFLALYLSYQLVSPFLHTIILACIFSALSSPLYSKILHLMKDSPWLASGVTLFLLVVLVCLPLAFFIMQLIPQASATIARLTAWLGSSQMDALLTDKVSPVLNWVNSEISWVELDIADVRASILKVSSQAGQLMLSWGTGFVVDSLNMAANFFLMLLIMFFLLKDGAGMIKTLKVLTPLREEQEDNIIYNLRRMSKAVFVGGFLVAGLQGLVGGIGLAIVGMPAMFLGTLMAFAALVPILGTALVWVPSVLYLWIYGQGNSAIFLLLWCAILVTSVDSFLRPVLIRGKTKTSLLFLFMSVLGGIKAFGALGIAYGPLILSFVGVMLGIYSDEYSESLNNYHAISKKTRRLRLPANMLAEAAPDEESGTDPGASPLKGRHVAAYFSAVASRVKRMGKEDKSANAAETHGQDKGGAKQQLKNQGANQ
jgi:predicted PurR-regulated permease PerM